MVDSIAKFPNELPVIRRVKYFQSLHEREYRAEPFDLLFLFNGHGSHGLAQVFLELAESNAESGQRLVLIRRQCVSVLDWQNFFNLDEREA